MEEELNNIKNNKNENDSKSLENWKDITINKDVRGKMLMKGN